MRSWLHACVRVSKYLPAVVHGHRGKLLNSGVCWRIVVINHKFHFHERNTDSFKSIYMLILFEFTYYLPVCNELPAQIPARKIPEHKNPPISTAI